MVKNPPTNAGDTGGMGLILGQEEPLEKEMTTHSSIFAWKNPWTEESGRLQSMGLKRVRHNWACTHCHTQCPQPCSRPPLTHDSARDSWTLMGQSGSVFCGVTATFFWVLVWTSCLVWIPWPHSRDNPLCVLKQRKICIFVVVSGKNEVFQWTWIILPKGYGLQPELIYYGFPKRCWLPL